MIALSSLLAPDSAGLSVTQCLHAVLCKEYVLTGQSWEIPAHGSTSCHSMSTLAAA